LNNNFFFITVFFTVTGNRLQVVQYSDPLGRDAQSTIPRGIELPLTEVESCLKDGPIHLDLRNSTSLLPPLTAYPRQLGCETAAYVPILQEGQLRGLVLIGARAGQELNEDVVTAFARTIRVAVSSLKPGTSPTEPLNERRTLEVNAINTLAVQASSANDLHTFYSLIHEQVRSVIGDHGFLIALYDQKTNSISIPYLFEDKTFSSIDTFPVGEGLTSILLRTGEPLMLVEDTEKRAAHPSEAE